MNKPEPTPEAVLIERLRNEVRPKLSIRRAAELAKLSDARWRQISKGFNQATKEIVVPVRAPADTLARMAKVVGATPDQLRQVGRHDAADELDGMMTAREHYENQTHPPPHILAKGLAKLIPMAGESDPPAGAQSREEIDRQLVAAQDGLWRMGGRLAHIATKNGIPDDVKQEAAQLAKTAMDDLVPQLSRVVADLPHEDQINVVAQVWRLEQAHLNEGETDDTNISQPRSSAPGTIDRSTSGGAESSKPPMTAADAATDKPDALIESGQGKQADYTLAARKGETEYHIRKRTEPQPEDENQDTGSGEGA